jgi:hypothetical protein
VVSRWTPGRTCNRFRNRAALCVLLASGLSAVAADERPAPAEAARFLAVSQAEQVAVDSFNAWLAGQARKDPSLLMVKGELSGLWSDCVSEVMTNETLLAVVQDAMTAAELREAMVFYQSPVGLKLAGLRGRMEAVQGQLVEKLLQARGREMVLILQGHSYPEAKGLALRLECFDKLKQIEAAKEHWATAKMKPDGAMPTVDDLAPYIKDGFPACPAPGTWAIAPLGQPSGASFPDWEMDRTQLQAYLKAHLKDWP